MYYFSSKDNKDEIRWCVNLENKVGAPSLASRLWLFSPSEFKVALIGIAKR